MVDLMKLFIPGLGKSRSPITPKRRRAVLALGGGGARGLAHLGVIEAVGETAIETQRIIGVSMGSFVGAMFAIDGNIRRAECDAIEMLGSAEFQMRQRVLCGAAPPDDEEASGGTFGWYSRVQKVLSAHRKLTRAVTSSSLISDSALNDSIDHLLPDCDLSDLMIPLSVVALDLLSGHRVVLERGSLRRAVLASSAIPGIFPAVPWDDMLLCDIGTIEAVPTMLAKTYASDMTIAVDVGQSDSRIAVCDTAMDVMMRVDDIGQRLMRRHHLKDADIVIQPDVGTRAWFDFSDPERMIEEGRRAARESLNEFSRKRVA